MTDRDFLDELVDERVARTLDFPAMVEAAERRRKLLGALAERRREGEPPHSGGRGRPSGGRAWGRGPTGSARNRLTERYPMS